MKCLIVSLDANQIGAAGRKPTNDLSPNIMRCTRTMKHPLQRPNSENERFPGRQSTGHLFELFQGVVVIRIQLAGFLR